MKKVGKNGNVISVFKFRTMIVDADKSEIPYTLINDERITKFGKVLRKTFQKKYHTPIFWVIAFMK